METWQLFAGLTAMLLLYALMSTVFGYELGPLDLAFGVIFGAVGLYAGAVLSERLNADRE